MRLVITQNVTADGAVEMLTDWFDPSDQDQELAAELRRQDESCDAVLLGRQTDDTTGVSDQLNRVTKYVVSATITDPQWRNSVVLAGRADRQYHGPPADRRGYGRHRHLRRCASAVYSGRADAQ